MGYVLIFLGALFIMLGLMPASDPAVWAVANGGYKDAAGITIGALLLALGVKG